ncbi:hypothetical protein SYNPS1DRAFT_28997 [Syncephalis pseudoplumigaleata]|uniref:Mid2 domain-containing protein n=1 Tax=Syncephalis pseudoplumigaleata TaxID=1712513 RepID=A0A4P9YYX3_9FUNG|nr:hypothetical protein SYNPS1DRAFT_28997 [Syncephalis pseudoplumigaleata]|eukprot:RKP25264.1 hypothetical protein SYNPS1DRAFT_28997 [Syncephalis pseudoplumigaleata]
MFRRSLSYPTAALLLWCLAIPFVSAGSCCFTTQTTPAGNNSYNITVSAVHSDIKKNNDVYRTIISIPQQYQFVGKATGGATCTNAAVSTSYDCTSNNATKFAAQISVQPSSSSSSASSTTTDNKLVIGVSIFRDQCQQSDSCPDVMADSSSSSASSSNDETVYLGPFGNVTKPVAIAIGVAFGVIAIGVAYAVLRRVFPGKTGGAVVRRPHSQNNNDAAGAIPMQTRSNDKDDPDASHGMHSYSNSNNNNDHASSEHGGLKNTLRQSRLWNAMSGGSRGQPASGNASQQHRWHKNRNHGYAHIEEYEQPSAARPSLHETRAPPTTITRATTTTAAATSAVVMDDVAEILPPKHSARNKANPQTMMTSVVVDLGVEPASTSASSRAASRQPSLHRSLHGDGHHHQHQHGATRKRSMHKLTDDGAAPPTASHSRSPSGHHSHHQHHSRAASTDAAMRRSKSTNGSKAPSTRSTSGQGGRGNGAHRRAASSHEHPVSAAPSGSSHRRSRSRSSQRRPSRPMGDDEEQQPSLPNHLDLDLLSRKLNEQHRHHANKQGAMPMGGPRSREAPGAPQLAVH